MNYSETRSTSWQLRKFVGGGAQYTHGGDVIELTRERFLVRFSAADGSWAQITAEPGAILDLVRAAGYHVTEPGEETR